MIIVMIIVAVRVTTAYRVTNTGKEISQVTNTRQERKIHKSVEGTKRVLGKGLIKNI